MIRLLFAFVASLLLAACASTRGAGGAGGGVDGLDGEAMGTTWSVRYVRAAEAPTRDALRAGIQAQLDAVDAQMSTWTPDSDLGRFNRAPAGTWQALPAELFTVLSAALALARDTGGAYDPTVGPLVDLWGFGPGPKALRNPDADTLAATRARVGWQRIELDAAGRRARQPGGASVDLSSIAPGYAVDQIARYLDHVGVHDYLVEHGGELRARGHRPGGRGWRVGIEQPDTDAGIAMVVVLTNQATGSSGDYRKFFERDGVRYSHHIDPRTGAPVTHALASVTVIAADAQHADATAAALSILGPEAGLAHARARGIAALFLIRTPDGFTQVMTPAFAAARP